MERKSSKHARGRESDRTDAVSQKNSHERRVRSSETEEGSDRMGLSPVHWIPFMFPTHRLRKGNQR